MVHRIMHSWTQEQISDFIAQLESTMSVQQSGNNSRVGTALTSAQASK